ncbi:MAG: thiamine-phosphate kinase [Methylophilaceae bacterium 17-44-8]|jgi:thiamine-monophosphate kinase|nr:MAG: thiamine-phosphate kinase [Methylophilales bacterium 28-44-11]OZA06268.1 MAG: thiamine-phosphate kinase [Methylophilaceae bacterium 17-44-8]
MRAEFDLIAKYFTRPTPKADLGVGDDAALIKLLPGYQLAISTDMSVVGTHFYADCPPEYIGWKSLAVNVSDMAAMGATPKWMTLALALPEQNPKWLSAFASGFFACADAFNIDLIGGDTTRGPLNITVQIMGEVPTGQALLRSNAQVGDEIWVSGLLGGARLGLAHLQQNISLPSETSVICLQALHHPQPRVSLGQALLGVAHSCIDISDGLVGDLGHILKASGVGAEVHLETMPCLPFLKEALHLPDIQQALLAGGDDYELCFTAPIAQNAEIQAISNRLGLPITCIGKINANVGLSVMHHGRALPIPWEGFDHFA